MSRKQVPRKSRNRQANEDENVVPLRDSALYRPVPKQGINLVFGLDEIDGQIVIRFPDGTFERIDVTMDDLDKLIGE